jgi:ribosome production factor 2
MEAREPKEVENVKSAVFVKGTHTGEVLNGVVKELVGLRSPNLIKYDANGG